VRILVTAKDRQVARDTAEMLFPRDVEAIGTMDRYSTTLGDEVTVAIFGGDLAGRTFDRIVVAQQKHLPAGYGDYLAWRLATGGRFDRHD